MKRVYAVSAITLAIILAACSSSKKTPAGVWINKEKMEGKSYSSVFIIVVTADIQARVRVEGDLEKVATARGLKAVKSSDVMPMDIQNPKLPTKEEVVSKVKASGCEAVFIAALLKKEESAAYKPGTTTYSQRPDYTFSGNYYGYYSNWHPTVSTPGYYGKDNEYFMQSNLFDVASEEKMWSVESKIFNPTDLNRFSETYTRTLIYQLQEAKIMKK